MPEETAVGFLLSAQPRSCAYSGGETMGMSAKDERCASPTGNGDDAAPPWCWAGEEGCRSVLLTIPQSLLCHLLPMLQPFLGAPHPPGMRCSSLEAPSPSGVLAGELGWGQGGIPGGVQGALVLERGGNDETNSEPSPGDGLGHSPQPLVWFWALLFGLFVKTAPRSPSGAFGTPRRPGAWVCFYQHGRATTASRSATWTGSASSLCHLLTHCLPRWHETPLGNLSLSCWVTSGWHPELVGWMTAPQGSLLSTA